MWLHFWSVARYDLRLSADEFFDITPRQLDALYKRHRYRVESNEFLFAQLTSWIANTGFRSTEKQMTPHDFMPSVWMKKAKQKAAGPKKAVRMTKKKRQALAISISSVLMQFARKKE